jgi:hypothetical protein
MGDSVTSLYATPGSQFEPNGPVTTVDRNHLDTPVYRNLGGAVAFYMTRVGMDCQWISVLRVVE